MEVLSIAARPGKSYLLRLTVLGERRSPRYGVSLILIGLRLCACVLLVFSLLLRHRNITLLVIAAILSTILLFALKRSHNGSDQVGSLVLIAGALAFAIRPVQAESIYLLFLASNFSIAYLVSGVAKIAARGWRQGIYLPQIMATSTFGHEIAFRVMSANKTVALVVSNMIIIAEIFISFAPWSPPQVAYPLVLLALSFHLSVALLMGLNTFVSTFAAMMPGAVFVSTTLYAGGFHQLLHF
jgi:hypothetical protein